MLLKKTKGVLKMYKVVLRNYGKSKGKMLFSCDYLETLNNYVYHKLTEKLVEFGIIDDDYQYKDENDFIDIERNNRLIATLYGGADRNEVDRALWYIGNEKEN
jgi:hypothetical protein